MFKVETVGDSYMTVGGIPEQMNEHAETICHVAIGESTLVAFCVGLLSACFLVLDTDIHFETSSNCCSKGMLWEARAVLEPVSKKPLQVRIGIHSGPLVAGVVAVKMPRYC